MDVDELRFEVDRITWYHSIPLGSGIVTPGIDYTPSTSLAFGCSRFG